MAHEITPQALEKLLNLEEQGKVGEAIAFATKRVDPESNTGIRLSVLEVRYRINETRKVMVEGTNPEIQAEADQIGYELKSILSSGFIPVERPTDILKQAIVAALLVLMAWGVYLKVEQNQVETALTTENVELNQTLLMKSATLEDKKNELDILQARLGQGAEATNAEDLFKSQGEE